MDQNVISCPLLGGVHSRQSSGRVERVEKFDCATVGLSVEIQCEQEMWYPLTGTGVERRDDAEGSHV
jgi:hypothetical protein